MHCFFNVITLAIPIHNAYRAYQACAWKIPDSWKGYTYQIESPDFLQFAAEAKVSRKVNLLLFRENGDLGGDLAKALGNHSVPGSDLAIALEPQSQISPLATNFAVRHELSHLINNDMAMRPIIRTIVSLAVAILGIIKLSPLSALLLTIIASISSDILYRRYQESRADDDAIRHSTNEELNAMKDLLLLEMRNRVTLRQQSINARLIFTSKGDVRFHFSQPSHSSRIYKIDKALGAQ